MLSNRNNNLSISFVTLFLIFSFLVNSNAFEAPDSYEKKLVLIQFNQSLTINSPEMTRFTTEFATIQLKPTRILSRPLNIWEFTFNDKFADAPNVIEMVKHSKHVRQAQLNHYVFQRQTIPNDTYFSQQWALNNTGQSGGLADADIDAPEAWDLATGGITATGDTIIVAIIDGGFDLNHNDIRFWKNYHEIPNNNIDDDQNGYVDDFDGWNAYDNDGNVPSDTHGTHVSGIAAAIGNNNRGISGVNWNVKVMPVAGSSGNESTVVIAYSYVLEMRTLYNQTNGAEGAFIVSTNASFGVDNGDPDDFPLWCGIYDALGQAGIINCGATANQNTNVDIYGDIPTACPSNYLISVTNTTSSDLKNSGAAYGLTTIDLGSPGTSIYSTVPGNSYSSLTGTSMATPHVTGAVGMLYSAASPALMQAYHDNPGDIALVMRDYLLAGVDSVAALQGITVTGGRLNVYNAVLNVQSYTTAYIEGYVLAETTNEPLSAKLTVTSADDQMTQYSDEETGHFIFSLLPGEYVITTQLQGYFDSQTETIFVEEDSTETVDILLNLTGPPPQDFSAISEINNQVPLSWAEPVTSDPAGYNIYRRQGEFDVYHLIASEIQGTTFVDTDVINGRSYYYSITSVFHDPNGESFFYQPDILAIPGVTVSVPIAFNLNESNGDFNLSIIDPGNQDGGYWEYGAIDSLFNSGNFPSAVNVWATGLQSNYCNNADMYLLSPLINLATDSEPLYLIIDHWYEFETRPNYPHVGFDGGNVALFTNAGITWEVIHPLAGYDDMGIPGLDQEPGFTGLCNEDGHFITSVFDLSHFINQIITLRFRVGTDLGFNKLGWYLASISIDETYNIENSFAEQKPELFMAQNYPNPFSNLTRIHFEIPQATKASLKLFNCAGQLVKTLIDDTITPGVYDIEWNGTNQYNQHVANGIYFYQLSAGDQKLKNKLLYLR